MKTITTIDTISPQVKSKKRVAAYCRVSKETDRTLHSLSAQVSYYNGKIQSNPNWEFAGIYSDEGISGASTKKREGFKELLRACEDGKIDIILVKSISRFARNTVDLLQTIRHLKSINVEVHFEEQNINTMSSEGELMITLLATLAQEEILGLSESICWSFTKKALNGEMVNGAAPYGYRYDKESRTLIVEPKEAEVVRVIFDDYLNKKLTPWDIANKLNSSGITTKRGFNWYDRTIRGILTNEAYKGDLLIGKQINESPLTKKKIKNQGQKPKYYIEEDHEPIISSDIFDAVQELYQYYTKNGYYRKRIRNCFTGNIICQCCGKPFARAKKTYANDGHIPIWRCIPHAGAEGKCRVVTIKEAELKNLSTELLGLEHFTEDKFSQEVDHIEVSLDDHLHFFLKDGNEKVVYYPRRGPLRAKRGVKANG